VESDLEKAIASCDAAVDKFSADLRDDEAVCLETRALTFAILAAEGAYDGIWTEERSKRVERIFEKAIHAHDLFIRKHGRASEFRGRLLGRYEELKKVFVRSPYVKSVAKMAE
jgi:hypothetical protein